MCYPQQLGRSWKIFVPKPSGTLSAMCTGQLSNFVCSLYRNHPELHGPSAPGPSKLDQPSGALQNLTVRDFIRHLHRNPPELCRPCAPDSAATLSAICTGTVRNFMPSAPGPSKLDQPSGTLQNLTVRDFIRHLHRNPPELCRPCAPDSSATLPAIRTGTVRNFMDHLRRDPPNLISHPESSSISSAIYAGTVQNLISFLPGTRNPSEPYLQSAPEFSGISSAFCPETPEPHQPSALEPPGNLSAICTGTLRNFISQLPRNCPEPHQPSAPEPSGNLISTEGSGTLRNLVRNLVLQLRRIAPELFWAKDPIASFAVGEKYQKYDKNHY